MSAEAHVRIDEGIKRGSRGKRVPMRSGQATKPSHPADLGTWVIPADLNPREVLERYLVAETTGHIAQEYGVSRKALTKWMRQVAPEEWKAVQIVRALANQEDAEQGIITAADALSLARARELLKSAQFNLQALDRDYQPKQQVTVEMVGDLGDRLRRARERVTEGEVVATQQPENTLTNQGQDSADS